MYAKPSRRKICLHFGFKLIQSFLEKKDQTVSLIMKFNDGMIRVFVLLTLVVRKGCSVFHFRHEKQRDSDDSLQKTVTRFVFIIFLYSCSSLMLVIFV